LSNDLPSNVVANVASPEVQWHHGVHSETRFSEKTWFRCECNWAAGVEAKPSSRNDVLTARSLRSNAGHTICQLIRRWPREQKPGFLKKPGFWRRCV
jgi:hypothetical protein